MGKLTWFSSDSAAGPQQFPPTSFALDEPNGLLAVGGDLSPNRILDAYHRGIFPWFEEDQPILWWSPDPRTVLFPAEFHLSRSLAKTLRRRQFEIRVDTAFNRVLDECAAPRDLHGGTWLIPSMRRAYSELHHRGYAHSVEAWRDGELVGGLYGLALGSVFFGESMFSRESNASKAAFATLVDNLQHWGFELVDCQVASGHLFSLGAREISRSDFESLLNRGLQKAVDPAVWTTWQQSR